MHTDCSTTQSMTVEATNDVYVSDEQLKATCITDNRALLITAKAGQVMNISMINFERSLITDKIYGTFKDGKANKEVIFGSGPRIRHLLQSSANQLELKLSQSKEENNRFMLHISGKKQFFIKVLLIEVTCDI